MLAAGVNYKSDNTSTEGNLSMMIFSNFGLRRPLWGLAAHASGDVRWTLIALALHWLDVFVHGQLTSWSRSVIARAQRGAALWPK
jgi:hypothetical protein